MKKSFKVLCLMLVAFMMSGCMKFNMNMDINSDKSMNLEIIVAFENKMMEKYNFKTYDNHKMQHDDILNQVQDIYKQLENGDEILIVNILEFLKKWLINHILKTDLVLGKYLTSINAEPVR